MTRLWLGNIEPGTSDDEIRALLLKYGFPTVDGIEHVEGDGSRPAVLVTFQRADPAALALLQPRIHDLYWKRRRLTAQIMTEGFG
jgi:hypothetical protein